MLTLTDIIQEYQDITNDTSTENKNRLIRRVNQIQGALCNMKHFPWLNKDFTLTSIANQTTYELPVKTSKVVSVVVENNNVGYPVKEIAASDIFNQYKYLSSSNSTDYPVFYHVRENSISFYPKFASSGLNIKLTIKIKPSDLVIEDYTTGTIAVTTDSATVTGTATSWNSSNAKAGMYIFIENTPYEIAAVGGATSITLSKVYEGATASGLSYRIGSVSIIPEEYHDILWLRPSRIYLGLKKQDKLALQLIQSEEDQILSAMLRDSMSSTTSNVWQPRRQRLFNINDFPRDIG